MRISGVNGTPRSALPPDRSTSEPAPTTLPPAASIAAIASRDERPVVTTSSTSQHALARVQAEAAAKFEHALRPLDEHRRFAQRASHFMADDHPAHRRRHDDIDPIPNVGRDLFCERARQPLGSRGVHQHTRALQVARAAQAGRKNEMAFEQRVGGAELVKDFVVGHHRSSPALGPRTAASTPGPKSRLRLRKAAPIEPKIRRRASRAFGPNACQPG